MMESCRAAWIKDRDGMDGDAVRMNGDVGWISSGRRTTNSLLDMMDDERDDGVREQRMRVEARADTAIVVLVAISHDGPEEGVVLGGSGVGWHRTLLLYGAFWL